MAIIKAAKAAKAAKAVKLFFFECAGKSIR